MPGHVDGFLAQGVGDGGIDLAGHGQFNDLDYILEGGLAAQGGGAQAKGPGIGGIAGDVAGLDEAHVVHVDGPVLEPGLGHRPDRPELQVDAGDLLRHLDGVLHAGHIAHHQRAAAVVHAPVRQSLNGDLWAVAEGISHGDAENRKIHCIPAFYVFSTFLC